VKVHLVEIDDTMKQMFNLIPGRFGSVTPTIQKKVFASLDNAKKYASGYFGCDMNWSGPCEKDDLIEHHGMVPGVSGTMSAIVYEVEVQE